MTVQADTPGDYSGGVRRGPPLHARAVPADAGRGHAQWGAAARRRGRGLGADDRVYGVEPGRSSGTAAPCGADSGQDY